MRIGLGPAPPQPGFRSVPQGSSSMTAPGAQVVSQPPRSLAVALALAIARSPLVAADEFITRCAAEVAMAVVAMVVMHGMFRRVIGVLLFGDQLHSIYV